MCFAKFPPVTLKASPKITRHKIHSLQFAQRNIVGVQSWHSSRPFQILIIPTILTMQLRLGIDCKFGLANTTICEHGLSKESWMKSDCKSQLKLETLDTLM